MITQRFQPGAFSAYRWIALQNDRTGRGPLASYFKGEVLNGRDTDIFTSNMCTPSPFVTKPTYLTTVSPPDLAEDVGNLSSRRLARGSNLIAAYPLF